MQRITLTRKLRRPIAAVGSFALAAAVVALATVWSPARSAADYPEPSPFPVAWELTFEHGTPKRIAVELADSAADGKKKKKSRAKTKAYWYMTYKVTNETREPIIFMPQFDLVTNDGEIHRSNRKIPKAVFDKIKDVENNDLLEPPTTFAEEINLGEDQARESVAIWEEPMRDMGAFSIFIAGLSGEWAELKDEEGNVVTQEVTSRDGKPVMNEETGEPETEAILLFKTLRLNFYVQGDDVYPGEDPVNVGRNQIGSNAEEWVMR